ncbi:MAG: hypothetical protein ACREFO_19195 [Acetobacteraceae bacterium]
MGALIAAVMVIVFRVLGAPAAKLNIPAYTPSGWWTRVSGIPLAGGSFAATITRGERLPLAKTAAVIIGAASVAGGKRTF